MVVQRSCTDVREVASGWPLSAHVACRFPCYRGGAFRDFGRCKDLWPSRDASETGAPDEPLPPWQGSPRDLGVGLRQSSSPSGYAPFGVRIGPAGAVEAAVVGGWELLRKRSLPTTTQCRAGLRGLAGSRENCLPGEPSGFGRQPCLVGPSNRTLRRARGQPPTPDYGDWLIPEFDGWKCSDFEPFPEPFWHPKTVADFGHFRSIFASVKGLPKSVSRIGSSRVPAVDPLELVDPGSKSPKWLFGLFLLDFAD